MSEPDWIPNTGVMPVSGCVRIDMQDVSGFIDYDRPAHDFNWECVEVNPRWRPHVAEQPTVSPDYVAALKASHAELCEALKAAVEDYDFNTPQQPDGDVSPDYFPDEPWVGLAREALTNAEKVNP